MRDANRALQKRFAPEANQLLRLSKPGRCAPGEHQRGHATIHYDTARGMDSGAASAESAQVS